MLYGTAYGGDWLYLNDHITNDLVGVQSGFDLSYRFLNCWKAFVRPEFGIFNNHTQLNYNMYAVSATTGQQYQASSETYANPNYPVHATGNDFSFLTQVDVGLDWQITRHFSVNGGYRVLAATGIVFPTTRSRSTATTRKPLPTSSTTARWCSTAPLSAVRSPGSSFPHGSVKRRGSRTRVRLPFCLDVAEETAPASAH